MNILFTICGRAGSKGIKSKNSKEFLGYPLPFYTFSAIDLFMNEHPEHECDIVLNTDSEQLMDIAKKFHRKVILQEREEGLAGDTAPKVAVIADCLEQMQKKNKKRYDMVVDLDLTSPLRTKKDLEALIEKKKEKDYEVVLTVTESRRNPYFNMVKKVGEYCEKVIKSDFTARQQAPEMFDMNASLYAYSPEFLKAGKSLFDGKCGMIHMYDTGILDLDHENDFVLMEVIAKYLFETNAAFSEIEKHISGCCDL